MGGAGDGKFIVPRNDQYLFILMNYQQQLIYLLPIKLFIVTQWAPIPQRSGYLSGATAEEWFRPIPPD